MNLPKSILITGGLGFIVSILQKTFTNFEKIYIIDSLISRSRNSFNGINKNIKVYKFDLNDTETLTTIVEKIRSNNTSSCKW